MHDNDDDDGHAWPGTVHAIRALTGEQPPPPPQTGSSKRKRQETIVNTLEDCAGEASIALKDMRALVAGRGWSIAEIHTGWCLHMANGKTVHRHSLGALKIFIETVRP